MDLFNVSYEILLLLLQRFFAHTEETDSQLKTLADASVALMLSVVRPLGDLVTTLPAGPEYPGRNGDPSFELFYDTDYVLPHREAAWILLTERIQQAAEFCAPGMPCEPQVADRLGVIRSSLNDIVQSLAAHLPLSARETPVPAEDVGSLVARAEDFYRTGLGFTPHPDASLSALAAILTSAYRALPAAAPGHARTVARLVRSVLRPLADSLPDLSSTASPGQPASQAPVPQAPVPQAPVPQAPVPQEPVPQEPVPQEPVPQKPEPSLWDVAVAATDLRVRLGAAAPAGLVEAVAALQEVAVGQTPAGERAQRIAEFEQRQRGLPTAIVTVASGPYLVTNVAAVRDHLGTQRPVPPQLALNGWLPSGTTGLWEINSIGEVVHDRHKLLIAVLSEGNATEDSGISLVQTVAQTAAPAPWPAPRVSPRPWSPLRWPAPFPPAR